MKIAVFFFIMTVFYSNTIHSQTIDKAIENALLIVDHNIKQLENVEQLLVVYNYKSENYTAILVALEKKDKHWRVKQKPMNAGIGKNGFALPQSKLEGDGKSPTGIFKLGKLFSYEKQFQTLLENQQTNRQDKWIDDVNSAQYNTYVSGVTNAKSYEKLLLNTDVYKYCLVIEYNTNPVVKGKGSAIFTSRYKKTFFYFGLCCY